MTTVIIKVASEVVFKAVTDDIVSTVLKKATMAQVFQERLDWFSEALRLFCILSRPQQKEYFRRVSSVNTKSLIFVFRAHNTQLWSEKSKFLTKKFCKLREAIN